MKNLNEPLENNDLIPIVEIAKLLYPYWNEQDESDFVDFNIPEFDSKGRMLVSSFGFGNSSAGVADYLFFENNYFKIISKDYFWTSDKYSESIRVKEFDQIILLKKLIEIGAITKEEIGL